MSYLTRQPSDRWRCVSSLWSSQGRTLSTWTCKNQSPFSCASVEPASHGTHISLWQVITYGPIWQWAHRRPLVLTGWLVSRWSERLCEDSLMLYQTDGSEPTTALTLHTTWSVTKQVNDTWFFMVAEQIRGLFSKVVPAVGEEQEVRCTDNHLQLPPIS